MLLHVAVYNHHQGALPLAKHKQKLPDNGFKPQHVGGF